MSSLHRVSEDIRDLLTGPYAISYTAFLISRFSIFQSISTEEALGNSIKTAIAFTFCGDLIRFLGIYISDKTVLKNRKFQNVKLSTALTSVFLINFLASLIPATVILAVDQEFRSFFIRVNSTTSFTFAGMTFANLIVAIVAKQKKSISLLRSRDSAISLMEAEAEKKLHSDQLFREKLAKSRLNSELSKLQIQIKQIDIRSNQRDVEQLVHEIEAYGERTVRAYSHSVLSELNSEGRAGFRGEVTSTLRYFFKINNLNFSPLPTIIVIFFGSGVSQATRNGFTGLGMTFMLLASLTPTLLLLKYIISKFVPAKTTVRVATLLIGIVIIFYSVLESASLALSLLDLDFPYTATFTALTQTISVFFVSVLASLYLQQLMLIDDLTVKLNKKEQLVAHLSAENAVKEVELAQLLHGPVQGKLASIVMSLGLYLRDSANRNEFQDGKWLQMAQQSLDEVSVMINSTLPGSSEILDFESYLGEAKLQYRMLLDISESISVEARQVISESQRLQSFTIDVLANALTNALRHGAARNLDLLIELSEDNTLVMQIADDGCGPADRILPGIGFNQIKAQSGNWSLEKRPQGGALLKVELELADAR